MGPTALDIKFIVLFSHSKSSPLFPLGDSRGEDFHSTWVPPCRLPRQPRVCPPWSTETQLDTRAEGGQASPRKNRRKELEHADTPYLPYPRTAVSQQSKPSRPAGWREEEDSNPGTAGLAAPSARGKGRRLAQPRSKRFLRRSQKGNGIWSQKGKTLGPSPLPPGPGERPLHVDGRSVGQCRAT